MNKKLKRLVKHVYKVSNEYRSGDLLAEREAQAAHYAACVEGGMVGIIRVGRDCDCVEYRREGVELAVPFRQWLREEDRHAYWLDGPERTYVVRPSRINQANNYSHDLILRAYEDGHPHYIVGGAA